MKKKTVYIPIEIKAREFVSQVLLSAKIAELGGRVYLGSKGGVFTALSLKSVRGGTLLYKGGMGNESGFQNLRKRSVSTVAVMDQEMSPVAILFSNPASRFVGAELDFVDRLYYVGQRTADLFFASRPDQPRAKVKTFGWPRVDLWTDRYSDFWRAEAENHRERFGTFVLFSSDFGILNAHDLEWVTEGMKALWALEPERQISDQLELDEYSTHIIEFPQVVKFLRELDQEPNFPRVVVRPHPSENHAIWAKALEGFNKTDLVYEGDIDPWLHASVAFLHRGCSTALPAELLRKPSGFIVSEVTTDRSDAGTSAFSKRLRTVEDALALVAPQYQIPEPQVHHSMIASLDGTASEKIASDLLALTVEPEEEITRSWRSIFGKRVFGHLYAKVLDRLLCPAASSSSSIPSNVAVNKMPGGVGVAEVRDVLSRLDMSHIAARQAGSDLVCIEKL